MISHERFLEKMKWLSDLTGQNIRKDTASAMWDELKKQEPQDLERAIKDLAYADEKVNLANLWKRLVKFRTTRVEGEAIEFSRKQADEISRWWASHRGVRQVCVNEYNCFSCQREYCDLVSIEAMQAIKDIMSGDKKYIDVCRELSKFKGLGWEKDLPENQPF